MSAMRQQPDVVPPGTVVVAIEGSSHADQAVVWGSREARSRHRPLTLIHVERPIGAQEAGWLARAGVSLDQAGAEIRAETEELLEKAVALAVASGAPDELEPTWRVGDPCEVLLDLAERAELLVVGSRGRGPVSSLLLGSVGVAMIRQASCPVVVVKHREVGARLRGVVAAVGGAGHSIATVEAAFREASLRGLPLTLAYCHPEPTTHLGGWRAADHDDPFYDGTRSWIAEITADSRSTYDAVDVDVELFAGHVAACVSDLSREHAMTVIGRHERSLHDHLGSIPVTTAIVERSRGPVLVVP